MLQDNRKTNSTNLTESEEYRAGMRALYDERLQQQRAELAALRDDEHIKVGMVRLIDDLQEIVLQRAFSVAHSQGDDTYRHAYAVADVMTWQLVEYLLWSHIDDRDSVLKHHEINDDTAGDFFRCETISCYGRLTSIEAVDYDRLATSSNPVRSTDDDMSAAYKHYNANYMNATYAAFKRELVALGIHQDAITDRANELTNAALELSLIATGGRHSKYIGAGDALFASIAAMPPSVRHAADAHLDNFRILD